MTLPRSLYTLLIAPRQFFENHPPSDSLGGALVVVLVVSLLTTLGVAAIGWTFAANIDATYTETVTEPWSESACENFERMNMSTTPEPCAIDQPKTRQVDVGAKLWDGFLGQLPLVFALGVVGWLLIGVALHVASAMAGGSGSLSGTLAVAGWGMLPSVVQVLVGTTAAVLTIQGMTFASDPAAVADQLRRMSDTTFGIWGTVGSVAATAWQVYIWALGLERARNLGREGALFAAGGVGVVTVMLSFVG